MAKKKKKATGKKKAKATRKKTTAKAKKKTKTTKKAKAKKKTTAKKKTKTKAKKGSGKKRKPNAAFMSPMQPSSALAEVVGSTPLPRTQVIKKLWQYIKKRNLQDPKNRRNILADATLQKVFNGKKVVNMFQMTKLVSKQLKAA